MGCILSIDQSTSGTKGLVFNTAGKLLARVDVPHRQIINEKGWVEHDADELYCNTLQAAKSVLEKAQISPDEVLSVGISNQRETAVCWDAATGKPLCNAIVWQCGRAACITQALEKSGKADTVKAITGLNLSPYFSAAKFAWVLRNVPEAVHARRAGTLRCGTVDAWLLYRLTDGAQFKTDYSNASRTQLLNLDTLQWDAEVAGLFDIPVNALPQLCMSDSLFGTTTFGGLMQKPVSIHAMLGDSHAALFANRCVCVGMAKATYGTGASMMMYAGDKRPRTSKGIATSLAWGMRGKVHYVLEGNVNYAGAVIQWLIQNIGIVANASEATSLSLQTPSAGGVYLVPAFSGLGAPYFNTEVRAAFLGMSSFTKREHLVRAAEECIAYQLYDVAREINSVASVPMQALCVDGGPTKDAFLMQFQADIVDIPLKISRMEELSGAGAAYLAALGADICTESDLFSEMSYQTISPKMKQEKRKALCDGWTAAIQTLSSERNM